jgi:hypothetical protein
MIDTITALLFTPITLVCILILGVILDHSDERGWASSFMIGALAIAYFMFDATFITILYGVGTWVVAGIVYSFLRWTWQCRAAVKLYSENKITKSAAMLATHLRHNKSDITYWTFAWPISLTATVLTDFLTWAGKALHLMFGNAYNWVSVKSQGEIDAIAEQRGDNSDINNR